MLPRARLQAMRDALSGGEQEALDRYLAHGDEIESRWMVLRVLGISVAALLVVQHLPETWNAWRTVAAASIAIVIYGIPAEILIVLAERTADRSAPLVLRLARPMELLVAPIAKPLAWLGAAVGRNVQRSETLLPGVAQSEVQILVKEGEQAGELDHERSEMIQNVLDFGDLTAGNVMVPRMRVSALDAEGEPDALLKQALESGHSRYPLYKERIDNVVGVLHVKDLMRALDGTDPADVRVEEVARKPVLFVPEGQSASTVLRDMRARRHHLGVVLDEFGGMAGVVTLEDLLEEIVGDIMDEHDVEDAPIIDLGEGRLMVDASVAMADLSRYLGAELPTGGDYNSLGGFLVSRVGKVPTVGTTHSELGIDFTVREADERRVAKVEIARQVPSPDSLPPRSSTRASAA